MTERLLRVVAPHYVAGAVFTKSQSGWTCTRAAPIIRWMTNKTPAEIHEYLGRKNYEWMWIL